MKAVLTVATLAVLLAACAPSASPTPQAVEEIAQLLTPTVPEGAVFFDGCSYMVSHPPALVTSDGMLFQPSDEQEASVLVLARRRTDAEQDLSLDALATQIGMKWGAQSGQPPFEPVAVTDYLGNTLNGLQADFEGNEGLRTRLMVVVRPQTLLGDLLPDDVVYEVVAQAPGPIWSEWAPLFEVMFQTFHPKDCGGV